LAELAAREAKFAATEAYFERYRLPPLDDEAIARIEAERRGERPKKARRAERVLLAVAERKGTG
jgi:hypothetical protein